MSIRHSLLALLSEGPKYGFQLRQEFEASTGDVWPLNVGQVYTTLDRLDRDGLVESDDLDADERQKNFRITEDGEIELSRWLRTPPDLTQPPRDELVTKALVDLARKETNPEMKKTIVSKLSIMGSKDSTEYMLEILNK